MLDVFVDSGGLVSVPPDCVLELASSLLTVDDQ